MDKNETWVDNYIYQELIKREGDNDKVVELLSTEEGWFLGDELEFSNFDELLEDKEVLRKEFNNLFRQYVKLQDEYNRFMHALNTEVSNYIAQLIKKDLYIKSSVEINPFEPLQEFAIHLNYKYTIRLDRNFEDLGTIQLISLNKLMKELNTKFGKHIKIVEKSY